MMARITSVISAAERSRRSVTARRAAGMSIMIPLTQIQFAIHKRCSTHHACSARHPYRTGARLQRAQRRRHFQKVFEQRMSVLSEDRLRMKLHPLHRVVAMAHAHDLVTLAAFVLRPRGHFQAMRQRGLLDDERMITRRLERFGPPLANPPIGMVEGRGLAAHHLTRVHYSAAEGLTDTLVAETHAKQRNFSGITADDVERHARLVGRTWARRDHDMVGSEAPDLIDADLIIAVHAHIGAELAQILHQVVGERIIIVDHQQHDIIPPARSSCRGPGRPPPSPPRGRWRGPCSWFLPTRWPARNPRRCRRRLEYAKRPLCSPRCGWRWRYPCCRSSRDSRPRRRKCRASPARVRRCFPWRGSSARRSMCPQGR